MRQPTLYATGGIRHGASVFLPLIPSPVPRPRSPQYRSPVPDPRLLPVSIPDQSRFLLAETRRASDAFRALAAPLTAAQLAWNPPGDRWSVAQVLEHLVVANHAYAEAIERRLADAPPARGSGTWKPTLVGGFLRHVLSPEFLWKLPSPRGFRPGPTAREGVLDAFLATQAQLAAQVERAAALDWRVGMASPESALVRFNLGDAFAILVSHTARHLGQARRVTALEHFPRGQADAAAGA